MLQILNINILAAMLVLFKIPLIKMVQTMESCEGCASEYFRPV
jgi:hypothetical protein